MARKQRPLHEVPRVALHKSRGIVRGWRAEARLHGKKRTGPVRQERQDAVNDQSKAKTATTRKHMISIIKDRSKRHRVLRASAAMHGPPYFDALPDHLLVRNVTQLLLDSTPIDHQDFKDFIAIRIASTGLKRLLPTFCTLAQLEEYDKWSLKWRMMKSLNQKLAYNHWTIHNQVCSVIACSAYTGQWIPGPEPGHGPCWGMTCSSMYGSLSVIDALAEKMSIHGHHAACRCIFPSMVPGDGCTFVTCSKRCYLVADAILKELMTNPTHVRATSESYAAQNIHIIDRIETLARDRAARANGA